MVASFQDLPAIKSTTVNRRAQDGRVHELYCLAVNIKASIVSLSRRWESAARLQLQHRHAPVPVVYR